MYQSLHTTVIGPLSERIEIQIRTEEMHRVAEEGIAAHWAYKEGKSTMTRDDEKFAWLRQLLEWQQDLKDPKEFLDTVKVDLFTDEVFVFTPKGDVRSLPRGATPVDFAYAIHSGVGEKCVGAKVNGKIVPLRYKLRNGDQVEVLTSPQAHPSKDWLTFAKTSRAQQRIRAFIKLQQREKSLILGRELTDREFKRFGLNLNKIMKSGEMKPHAETYGFRSEEDLLVAVGYGKIQPGQLVDAMVPKDKVEEVREKEKQPSEPGSPSVLQTVTNFAKKVVGRKSSGGVLICGIDDLLVRFGRCCNPVPGDAIVGFITRGRGVTVHTAACTKAMATDPERKVDVAWDVKGDFRRPPCAHRRSTGPARRDVADLQQKGREHQPGELSRDERSARREHLRSDDHRLEAAHRSHAQHREVARRPLRRAGLIDLAWLGHLIGSPHGS